MKKEKREELAKSILNEIIENKYVFKIDNNWVRFGKPLPPIKFITEAAKCSEELIPMLIKLNAKRNECS